MAGDKDFFGDFEQVSPGADYRGEEPSREEYREEPPAPRRSSSGGGSSSSGPGYAIVAAAYLTMMYFLLVEPNGGLDALKLWEKANAGFFSSLSLWAMALVFVAVPITTFAKGNESLASIAGSSINAVIGIFNKQKESSSVEEKNQAFLQIGIYAFLVLGVFTVVYLFLRSFGSGYVAAVAGKLSNGTSLLASVGNFLSSSLSIVWAAISLVVLSLSINFIKKKLVDGALSSGGSGGMAVTSGELIKVIIAIFVVIGVNYAVVNSLSQNAGNKDIQSVIGIGGIGKSIQKGPDGAGEWESVPGL